MYVVLRPAFAIAGTLVPNLLISAYASIEQQIDNTRDGPLLGGYFHHGGGNGLALNTWTDGESTLLLSEMASVCTALMDYMEKNGFGALSFFIKDGPSNNVGQGYIGYN